MNLAMRAAFALVLAAGLAWNQTSTDANWQRVQAISAGQPMRVQTVTKKHDGVFVRATHTTVELSSDKDGQISIERSEVTQVLIRSKSHRGRNTALGTAIGAAVGIAAYATFGRLLRNEGGDNTGMMIVVPGSIGAAIGAVIPTGRLQKIYDVKR